MWAGVEKAASDYVMYARSKVRQNGMNYVPTLIKPEVVAKWFRDNRWKYKLTDEEVEESQARAVHACQHIYKLIKRDLGEQADLL